MSPTVQPNSHPESNSSIVNAAASVLEIQRLKEELISAKNQLAKMASYEDGIQQARTVSTVIRSVASLVVTLRQYAPLTS